MIVRSLATGTILRLAMLPNTSGRICQRKDICWLCRFRPRQDWQWSSNVRSATGTLRVLDSSSSVYSGLSWRKDGADLAALRSKSDEKRDGPTQIVLAWNHLGESSESAHQFDPGTEPTFPTGMRIVAFRKPSWSADGSDVFCGIAKWDEKPPKPKDAPKDAGKDAAKDTAKEPEEQASVAIWHWRDTEVMPKQTKSADANRHRNVLAVWHVEQKQFVQLGSELITEDVSPLKHQPFAYAREWKAYAMDRSIGRPAADLYLVDLATGNPNPRDRAAALMTTIWRRVRAVSTSYI